MCGILTYYSKSVISKETVHECLLSLTKIKHRGPDAEGLVLINTNNGAYKILNTNDTPDEIITEELNDVSVDEFNLILGHRRLSVIDLSINGHQPMRLNKNWIVFNGEIYNYIEIRDELKSLGCTFNSESDTEVILKAYEFWGESCLKKFNGMWSFVLWDNQKKALFVSNDRFGVKPLYYNESKNALIYFSEIKQIKVFKDFDNIINKENCDLYLNFKQVSYDDTTLFKNVLKFPSGHYELFNIREGRSLSQYYSIDDIKKNKISLSEAIHQFKYIFHDAVKIRMRADVQWGIGLSGGLDSSSVLDQVDKILKEKKSSFKPITFSAVFPDMEGDETIHIENMISDNNFHSFFINPYENFSNDDFDRHLYYQEQPPISTSFYAQWKVAELVKNNGVTVNLVGQGADEIFGGYHAHFYRYCRSLILKGKIIRYLKEVSGYSTIKNLPINDIHRIVINELYVAFMFKLGLKKEDNGLIKYWNEINKLTDFMKAEMTSFQLPYYLLSDDRTSMAHSVETRHPFLDYRLVDFAFSLPDQYYIKDGWSKYIVRKSMIDLPEKIRWRRDKKGFTTPQNKIIRKLIPESGQLETEFRKYCLEKTLNIT